MTNRNVIVFSCGYIMAVTFLGIYALALATFSPSALMVNISKWLSVVFLMCYLPLSYALIMHDKKLLNRYHTKFKKFMTLYFGVPLGCCALALVHYFAFATGLPAIITKMIVSGSETEVMVTSKYLSGRHKRERIIISGFGEDFPVTRSFYNSVDVGQKIPVVIRQTRFGIDIEFKP